MTETIPAVRTYGPRDYRIEAVPVPEPRPGELLIEVGAVVICGVGNIGLCVLQIARLFQPSQLIALDTKDYRLDLALDLGATEAST